MPHFFCFHNTLLLLKLSANQFFVLMLFIEIISNFLKVILLLEEQKFIINKLSLSNWFEMSGAVFQSNIFKLTEADICKCTSDKGVHFIIVHKTSRQI